MSGDRKGGKWAVQVVTGQHVRLEEWYDQFEDAGSLFGLTCRGFEQGGYGRPITVNGRLIAVAWRDA